MIRRAGAALAVAFLVGISPLSSSQAGVIDFNAINPASLVNGIPQDVADQAVKLFAIYAGHRPYSGATSISKSNNMDINAEATLMKLGSGLFDALTKNNLPIANNSVRAVPSAKVNLRKGFGENVDVGLSGLVWRGDSVIGGDIKFVLSDPEEGISWALRLCYTHINLPDLYIRNMNVYSPELVMSRRLTFAEPYLGIGGRFFSGTFAVDTPQVGPIPPQHLSKGGGGNDAYAFTGLYFRILGAQGLRMGIEGSFDVSGYHTIGGVFGLGF